MAKLELQLHHGGVQQPSDAQTAWNQWWMRLDEAMRWLATKGGKVHVVRRTDDHHFFQVVVPPHRSDMIGVKHHGSVEVRTSDPAFEHAFVRMVDSIKRKVGT